MRQQACPRRCNRGCGEATAQPRRSRLRSPRLDSTPHLLVGDRAAGVGIGKPTLNHCREGKLPDDFLKRGVFRLVLDQADQLLLDGTHAAIVLPPCSGPANTGAKLRPSPACHARPSASAPRSTAQSELLGDRKSTRLNSSHSQISYAVFCLKKKKNKKQKTNK